MHTDKSGVREFKHPEHLIFHEKQISPTFQNYLPLKPQKAYVRIK